MPERFLPAKSIVSFPRVYTGRHSQPPSVKAHLPQAEAGRMVTGLGQLQRTNRWHKLASRHQILARHCHRAQRRLADATWQYSKHRHYR